MSLFLWINRIIRRKKDVIFPTTYVVEVSLQHPRIINRITTVLVAIDAHDKQHARRQLRRELTITVGKAVIDRRLR